MEKSGEKRREPPMNARKLAEVVGGNTGRELPQKAKEVTSQASVQQFAGNKVKRKARVKGGY